MTSDSLFPSKVALLCGGVEEHFPFYSPYYTAVGYPHNPTERPQECHNNNKVEVKSLDGHIFHHIL